MVVKKECVVKHLKHDYKAIGVVIGASVGIILALAATVWAVAIGIPTLLGFIFNAPYGSAYNLLNTLAACIVVIFSVGIAVFCDAKSFEYEVVDDYGYVGKNQLDTGCIILIALSIGLGIVYLPYTLIDSLEGISWESPLLSAIIFTILILIGTPVGCAIARCKE